MNTHADKAQNNKSQPVANRASQAQTSGEASHHSIDRGPESVAQKKLQKTADNSPQALQLKAFQDIANRSGQAKTNNTRQLQLPVQRKENNTGLPDQLKAGIENLSGISMDDVKVHRNSSKPAQLQAHAYAQGTNIHLAPGQEKHLPHEAWHVVQQKQGRVKPTVQLKGKVNINDDSTLEKEADEMGAKALQMKADAANNDTPPSFSTVVFNARALIQRKVMVNGSPYKSSKDTSQKITEAIEDEFLRYYENEKELLDHIDNDVPGQVGLIKPRALWYRIPFLPNRFFVFGESHAAVRGKLVKKASNIKKPILDEQISGWTVDEPENDETTDAGLDENSSKLYRALEAWNPHTFAQKQSGSGSGGQAPLPKIPKGETSTRDTEKGTYRLIVHGEGGEEELWKPKGDQEAPQSTHDFEGEVLAAIRDLFEKVFATEIRFNMLDTLEGGEKVEKAWGYFKTKAWVNHPQAALNIQLNVRAYLLAAAKKKASGEYGKLQKTHGDVTETEDKTNWTADDYRNEFMFVKILEGAKSGKYAFATIGNNHLKALKDRLAGQNIPYVTLEEFFGSYSKEGVDTKPIAYANSPLFRQNQRLKLWLDGAFLQYPNLQQFHLDMLNNHDLGEFVLKGIVSKWQSDDVEPSGGDHHKPVQLQFFRDIKKAYPNCDDFLPDITMDQIGEFLLDEKIAAWDALGQE